VPDRAIAVFHSGRQHAYETAAAFVEDGRLAWFATSLYYDPQRGLGRVVDRLTSALPHAAVRALRARQHPMLDGRRVRVFGSEELIERAAAYAGLRGIEHFANERGNRLFARRVARMALADSVRCLWGFDTASEQAFVRVKPAGIRCVLEQSVAYPRLWARLLVEEQRRAGLNFDPSPQPYPEHDLARADRELALADAVVCGSEFVRDSLVTTGLCADKLHVIPYGADPALGQVPRTSPGMPFNLLFVGHFGLRKGAFDLLAALRELDNKVRLTVVGHSTVAAAALQGLGDRIRFLGKRDPADMAGVYQSADALVLPSLFEGSALVVYEALMAGLPAIVTANAGSVVRDGVEGFVVPLRQHAVLAERIRALAAPDGCWPRMSRAARARGVEFPWSRYRAGVRALADRLLGAPA
jgi:glycosyltransferase involved in cell wall biosynthesis